MTRARRVLRVAAAVVVRPSLLGAAWLLMLAVIAARGAVVAADAGELGRQGEAIARFVHDRYGDEIARATVAIVAAAIAIGGALGAIAGAIVRLRDRLAGDARSPVNAALASLGVTASMHAVAFAYGLASAPQLYDDAWYARGSWRRTVQVIATDVLGPRGVAAFGLAWLAVYLAGPPSQWSSRLARAAKMTRAIAPRAPFALGAAVVVALALVLPSRLRHARAASAAASAPSAPTRPNVVVLAVDSLRADHLDARVAPHLAALADRGARFDRAYVSLPRTFPSWVTILTGRHPHHHGVRSMFARWEERARDFDALPERLAKSGYATAVVSDYAGDIFGRVDLGFQRVDVPSVDFRVMVRQRAIARETPLLPFLHGRLGRRAFPVLREMSSAADPDLLADDAIAALDALDALDARDDPPRPFFLTVFFSTAHFPYAAPAPWYERFARDAYRGRFKYDKPVGLGADAPLDDADVAQVRALYDGAVASVDAAADRVLARLARLGRDRDTIVVITADHGETLFDHGHGQGHGDHLFGDEGTHVPLVIVDPRRTGARRVAQIARDVDLAPTLYALTGVAPPGDLDGRSLVPALDGEPLPPALAYAETGLWLGDVPALPASMRLPYPGVAGLTEIDAAHGDEVVLQKDAAAATLVARHRMVRDERWKLIYAPGRAGVTYLLYDTERDPGETRDVSAEHPAEAARLRGELWRWMLRDPAMVERGGLLVPRAASEAAR